MTFYGKIASLISLLLLFTVNSKAQWFDDILTESDWEYLYQDGFYDYNSYLILNDLSQGRVMKDTADFIVSTLGISNSESFDRQIFRGFNESIFPNADAINGRIPSKRLYWRFGNKLVNNQNTGYAYVAPSNEFVSIDYKILYEKNNWMTDRRSINFNFADYNMTVGNYSPSIGLGMTIGRYDFRPLGLVSGATNSDDFRYPDNSYYNGLYIMNSNYDIMFSVKSYNKLQKSFMGAAIHYALNNYSIGLAFNGTELKSPSDSRRFATGSIFLANDSLGLKSEIGYAESGMGVIIRVIRNNWIFQLWNYDKSFFNLQSSSYAHFDYEIYEDSSSELLFRQPQKGESGLFVSRQILLKSIYLRASSEIWKRNVGYPIKIENSLILRYWLNKSLQIAGGYSEKYFVAGKKNQFSTGINYSERFRAALNMSLWFKQNQIDKSYSKYYLFLSVPVESSLVLSGRIRWNLNGDLDYFIEEKSFLMKNIVTKITYRWNSSYRNKLGPFYFILEGAL